MKIIRRMGIKFINFLPLQIKWFIYSKSIFRKRIRIDFVTTRNIFLSGNAKILLIGANDGISFDNLLPCLDCYQARGLLLEPSSRYFNQLVENTKEFPNLIPLKIALSRTNSFLNFYQLNDSGLQKMPDWGRGIGSFWKEHLMKFENLDEEDIEIEVVEGRTFDSLIETYGLFKVDYLQIDTEGFDAEIIKMIDFRKFSAFLLKFEVVNISKSDFLEVREILNNEGYYLDLLGEDMVAYSKNVTPYFI